MNRVIIRLTSVTYALRAQKLLEQYGIRSHIKKMVQGIKVNGCGYGLEVTGDTQRAVAVLRSEDIRIVEVVGDGAV